MPFPVDNIRTACKAQGITLAELERALKIGNGVIARWENQKSSPPYDRIVEIAAFLNTPVVKLTGEQKETPAAQGDGLTDKQSLLITLFERLTEAQQDFVIAQLQGAAQSPPDRGAR